MKILLRLGEWLKKAFLVAVAVLCVVVIFWGILYKVFLPFTPLWVDEITIVAVPLALLIAWAIGSRPADRPSRGDEGHVKPVEAIPAAVAQLESNDSSRPE